MAAALSRLPLRSRTLLERRFGLTGDDPHTLAEVGARFGISRERRLEVRALDDLGAGRALRAVAASAVG